MKPLLIFVLLLFLPSLVLADEPPDWRTHFKQYSQNSHYVADISPKDKNQVGSPWDISYKLELKITQEKGNEELLWTREYFHSGYSQVIVSNDGRYVAYVEAWFYPNGSLVRVYSQSAVLEWSAKDFELAESSLPETVSHRIWLRNSPKFLESPDGKTIGLELPTYKGTKRIKFER